MELRFGDGGLMGIPTVRFSIRLTVTLAYA